MPRRRRERPHVVLADGLCTPGWIKNPENNPGRVAGRPNWIKNPENDPERVVSGPNWIKNPGNDPAREEETGRLQSGWSGISRRICYLCSKRKVQWKVTISE